MAQYNKNQQGGVNPQTDEHGNIIRHTGQGGIGEQIKEHIPGMGQTDDCKTHLHSGTGATTAPGGGVLGGQMKEGMPGMGHRDDRPRNTTGTGATTTPGGVGFGEKMKENVPGMGHKDDKTCDTTGMGGGGGFGVPGDGQRDQRDQRDQPGQEKKGAMDKIKEKLPGHRAATLPVLAAPVVPAAARMSPPGTAPVDHNQDQTSPPGTAQHNKLVDGAMKMICFCLPTAVAIALQSLQTKSQLPLAFHFLIVALLFSFNFLFLGNFITPKFPEIAQVLEWVGVFFAVTAIYIAITIPLPVWLKCITWTIFVISFFTIVACFRRT